MLEYQIYSYFRRFFKNTFKILLHPGRGFPGDQPKAAEKLAKSLLLLNFAREKPEQNPEKFSASKLDCATFHKGRRKLPRVNNHPAPSFPPVLVKRFTS